ncbi:MAG: hypothetical protein IIC99_12315 [Chloroflexi bacterium]|nr:hypothetical protein [Chloroflexota bacterium]
MVAAIAITVVPANSVKRDLGRLASAMREAAVPFDELVTGGQSVTGFTTETTVEMTSGGVLRAACTGNLNARRAGFPLPPGAAGMIPSNTLERNVVLAVHQYCRLLHDIECPLPWQLGISLLGIHEFTMVVGPGERSDVFDGKKLPADPLIVQDYDAVATRENVARLLKGTFDCIWREFGLGYSRNYDVKGNWTAKL